MPLAGAPLRPLEYFLICQVHRSLSFSALIHITMGFIFVQPVFFYFLKNFSRVGYLPGKTEPSVQSADEGESDSSKVELLLEGISAEGKNINDYALIRISDLM